MRPLPYANIFIHVDEHVRREIMSHRSLKHQNIIRSKEMQMQMDEHVQREITNHKSLKNPNIIRFKKLLFSIRQH
ncbi:serine/threonine-protein kinase SAPK1-like [Pyrus x bretschneideri]|uniref:serine/threonine-protein kinase SAPK1-like n=1 Tax=Pyrus x bretschneideri TaxID=225117 RepID=UPI002030A67D|nr:serine/threonine-protein kinase SAPK1-like [Pyrus x bretschneideri]